MLVQAESSLVFPVVLSVQNLAVRSLYFILISTLKLLQVFASKTSTSMMIGKLQTSLLSVIAMSWSSTSTSMRTSCWRTELSILCHTKLNFVSSWNLCTTKEHAFQVKLCFLRAAFSKVCTGKMIFEIGAGGDGKGMEAYLDKNLLGSHQTTTLDCGVFLDQQEFRKSGEFAWGKCNVRIQEMDSHGRFIADIWKRFVVDEEIDCHVNYGFTSKRKFGDSMKIQERNYENVPVIEEVRDRLKACEHLKRRVVCLQMGKAQFVTDMDQVHSFLTHSLHPCIFVIGACHSFLKTQWMSAYR